MTISDSGLQEKVIKLMGMAGTKGGSYSSWTINQLVHGLREAVAGANPQRVEHALVTLEREGTVKLETLPEGNTPGRWVLLTKFTKPPEPLEESPFAVPADGSEPSGSTRASADLDLSAMMRKHLFPECKESTMHEPSSDEATWLKSIEQRIDAFEKNISSFSEGMRSVVSRIDNVEDVMNILNGSVAVSAQEQKKLRGDIPKLIDKRVEVAKLGGGQRDTRRIAKVEEDVHQLMLVFEKILEKVDEVESTGTSEDSEDKSEVESVGVVSSSDDWGSYEVALNEIRELARAWSRSNEGSMNSSLVRQLCSGEIMDILLKHGIEKE